MSLRKITPVDDGAVIYLFQTTNTDVYISASYKKKQKKKFSLHKLLVGALLVKQFGVTTSVTTDTLPQVKTIKQTNLNSLNDDEIALALAIKSYLVGSLDLEPSTRVSKHSITFEMIIRSREDPSLISKFTLLQWTERDINTYKYYLKRNAIGNNNFNSFFNALLSQDSNSLYIRLLSGLINKSSEESAASDYSFKVPDYSSQDILIKR